MSGVDLERRVAVVVGLCEMFGRTLSKPALSMFVDALADVPVDRLELAAGRCIRESKFMPTPAVLREAAGMGTVAAADKALLAWAAAREAAREFGPYQSVKFESDPAITRAILAMGGWVAFCCPSQDEQWHRREFLDAYRAASSEPGESNPVLRGIGTGPRNMEPVLIGTGPERKSLPSGERTDAECMGELRKRLDGRPA